MSVSMDQADPEDLIYCDDLASVRLSTHGGLYLNHAAIACWEGLGPAQSLSLWTHEKGAVLASVDMRISVPLTGDISPLLKAGVVDQRQRWKSLIAVFDELIQAGSTSIPFFTADDPFDLNEALSAVQLHFADLNTEGGILAKVWSSRIPSDHPHKYEYQGKGWMDVVSGFWGGGNLTDYVSEEAMKEAWRKHLVENLGVKSLLLRDVENLELCQFGVTSNFVSAIDDAIDLVEGWGLTCAVGGSVEAWWALKSAANGPAQHTFRRIHIPSDERLTADFMRTMQRTFDNWVPLPEQVLNRVFQLAGKRKYEALTLIGHLAGVSYGRDWAPLSVEDVEAFCGPTEQLIRPCVITQAA